MDQRPQILWRRRSVFVAVVLAVMIGSTVSVLAATGSGSAKRYYACVVGSHKTLNLTSAGATCPKGQRKISFGEGGRGPRGATGAAGATGPEGKAGATGPEGKVGPEGKQGKEGNEGKEGAPGQAGKEGKEGPEGPRGEPGPAGTGSIVYAASSGEPAALTTGPGGLSEQVAVLPLSGDQAGSAQLSGGTLNLTGGPGQIVPAQTFPITETVVSMTVFTSTTAALTLVGTTVTVTAQLYTSTTPDNTFTPVPGAVVTAAPFLTGVIPIGAISNGITTGLAVPITAETRGVIVVRAEANGVSQINTVPMYVSASISAA